jgi:hypothetical protein
LEFIEILFEFIYLFLLLLKGFFVCVLFVFVELFLFVPFKLI